MFMNGVATYSVRNGSDVMENVRETDISIIEVK